MLVSALSSAGVTAVPEDLDAFRRFTEGPLRAAAERQLHVSEVEQIFGLIGHVLWMATSDVQSRRELDDADDASGMRAVEPVPVRVPAPDASSISGAIPKSRPSVTLGRVTRAVEPPRGIVEIGPDDDAHDSSSRRRRLRVDILVLSLDPLLVTETSEGLAGRGRAIAIGSAADLARHVTAAAETAAQLVIVIDSALPSIDVRTFAGLSAILPPGTRVVLWGVDDRQKQRLSVMFPVANGWIASGSAASPIDVIFER